VSPQAGPQAELVIGVRRFLRQFRLRLHDRRFWIIQGLVLAISVAHTSMEATHALGYLPDLYLLPVSVYFIPVVYAGLNFGLEGALPTALWCCLLVVPNLIFFHHGWERLGVFVQLAIITAVAILIARRVETETAAARKAEAAGARLAELNATAAASTSSLQLSEVLRETVAAMLEKGKRECVWIVYAPAGWGAEGHVLVASGPGTAAAELRPEWESATRSVLLDKAADAHGGSWAVVPVRASGRLVAALGMSTQSPPLSGDDLTLQIAIGQQLGVALDNIRNYEEAQRTLNELRRAQRTLETYVQLATDAQEEERRRLARELHDDTIQTLVIIKGNLDSMVAENRLPATARKRLLDAQETIEGAIDNVRRFSRDLRPSLLDDLGLVHAVDWLVNDATSRTGIEVDMEVTGEPRRLVPNLEVAVYRVIQEALRNVERHSGASRAHVTLEFSSGMLTASVVDDGHGFSPADALAQPNTGLGLLGMQERAKLAGAELSIRSEPGRGTRVTLAVSHVGRRPVGPAPSPAESVSAAPAPSAEG
jgi:signal transduction histidine kinase